MHGKKGEKEREGERENSDDTKILVSRRAHVHTVPPTVCDKLDNGQDRDWHHSSFDTHGLVLDEVGEKTDWVGQNGCVCVSLFQCLTDRGIVKKRRRM